jgi:hypothetical protein
LRIDHTVINQADEEAMRFRMVVLARREPSAEDPSE